MIAVCCRMAGNNVVILSPATQKELWSIEVILYPAIFKLSRSINCIFFQTLSRCIETFRKVAYTFPSL